MKTAMNPLRDVLRADDALRNEFLAAPGDAAASEVLVRRGWSVTADDLRELREGFAPGTNELSDAELEMISGGTGSNLMKTRHDTAKNSISNVR